MGNGGRERVLREPSGLLAMLAFIFSQLVGLKKDQLRCPTQPMQRNDIAALSLSRKTVVDEPPGSVLLRSPACTAQAHLSAQWFTVLYSGHGDPSQTSWPQPWWSFNDGQAGTVDEYFMALWMSPWSEAGLYQSG